MFQVIYESFKFRLKFVQSASIHKEFCMQKNKVKGFICCCFTVMAKKNQCGINWKSSTIKPFLFQTHLKPDLANMLGKWYQFSHPMAQSIEGYFDQQGTLNGTSFLIKGGYTCMVFKNESVFLMESCFHLFHFFVGYHERSKLCTNYKTGESVKVRGEYNLVWGYKQITERTLIKVREEYIYI